MKQSIVTLDMEGVLTPEIWIAVAEKTGIPELRRTTRDEPDYDKLMKGRLGLLDRHGLNLSDIQGCIAELSPLPGAKEFLDELRTLVQVVILSDTFEQFASPLLRQLTGSSSRTTASSTTSSASASRSARPWPRSSG
jgi:phosphoserine/homoserine phosphotransferase